MTTAAGAAPQDTAQAVVDLARNPALSPAKLYALARAAKVYEPALTAPCNAYAPDVFTASWFARYISSYAGTIAGGTSEIQLNIIAQRVLGLP